MIINLSEFPWLGDQFDFIQVDLMIDEDGRFMPIITYLKVDDENSGFVLTNDLSFDTHKAAAILLGSLISNGFFPIPVLNHADLFNSDGEQIGCFEWSEHEVPKSSLHFNDSIH